MTNGTILTGFQGQMTGENLSNDWIVNTAKDYECYENTYGEEDIEVLGDHFVEALVHQKLQGLYEH